MSYGNYGPPSGPPPGQHGQYQQHQQHQQQYYGGNQGGYGAPPGGGYGGGYGAPGGAGAAGGFNPGPQQGPPPGADPQLWQWFAAVDIDRSGHISASELQQALVNGDWSPFDLDTVKLLMSMFDQDRSGTIAFSEFSGLWQYIKDWQNVFRHFDKDRSGSIEGDELKSALSQFGYNLNPQLLQLLERKYVLNDNKATAVPTTGGGYGVRTGGITFDRFVRCCVVVRTLTESFNRLDTQRSGWITLNYDTFLQTVLSAP